MTEEKLIKIAVRVPPGDNWELISDKGNVINGLVNTLTAYLRTTQFKGHYRLAPLDGVLYAIIEEEVAPPEPQLYDLYGEY